MCFLVDLTYSHANIRRIQRLKALQQSHDLVLEILQSFGISWRKNCPYRDCRQLSSISVIEFQMDDCGSSTILHAHCIYNVSGCCSLLNDIVLFVRTGTYVMNAISFRMFRSLRSKWPNMQIESTKVSISIQMKECLTFCN